MKDAWTLTRRVNYYETDAMAIVHHSNYIRWMEEARIEYMRGCGIDYAAIESRGILMPVVRVCCNYKRFARFGDTVEIEIKLSSYTGARLLFAYEIRLADGGLLVEAASKHCFVSAESRKPVNAKKALPEESKIIEGLLPGEKEEKRG